MTTPLTQATFLGASVVSFNSEIGWGSTPSVLTLTLVEDPAQNQHFTKPDPGTPVVFSYGNFSFGGIIQKWTEIHNLSMNPGYEVVVNDPREILEGAQVILSEYGGPTEGVPNLINAYGAYEFGFSGLTDQGIPWNSVLPVLEDSVLTLNGYQFTVDYSNLPKAPFYYVMPGLNESVLSLISTVCFDGGCDFIVNMTQSPQKKGGPKNVITIDVIFRVNQSPSANSSILKYVNANTNIQSYTYGKELRNEPVAAFLMGGPIAEIYQSASLMQFWGFDVNGNPITNSDVIPLDARPLNNAIIGPTYVTSVTEMRIAMGSQRGWEAYLALNNPDLAAALGLYPALNLGPLVNEYVFVGNQAIDKAGNTLSASQVVARVFEDTANRATLASESDFDTIFNPISALYKFIVGIAREYYGRKYLCQLPFVLSYIDQYSQQVVFSRSPV